ncbi:MAG: hypothetical protein IPK13_01575 [Deltaproteobacteria bacterium]|nr:hypothetical protein [Deltaproteobacteria bacterium]
MRRRIEAEKIKIERRLKSATQVNEGGPVLSGGNVRYELAGKTKSDLYRELERRAEREIRTQPRARPTNGQDQIVRQRGFKVLRTKSEEILEFQHQPNKCSRPYRVVALRKNISVMKGEEVLIPEIDISSTSPM